MVTQVPTDQTINEHDSNIFKSFFEKIIMITQAQILHGLIKYTNLKHATEIWGFQDSKHTRTHENMSIYISKSFS